MMDVHNYLTASAWVYIDRTLSYSRPDNFHSKTVLQHSAHAVKKGALFLPPSPISQRLVSQGEEG